MIRAPVVLPMIAAALVACGTGAVRRGPVLAGSTQDSQQCAHRSSKPRMRVRVIESRSSTATAVSKTVNEFDAAGRVVATMSDRDGDGQIDQTVTRHYDSTGQLIEVQEAERTHRFLRDRDGRVVAREIEARGRVVDHIALAYDDHGRVTREQGELDDVRYIYDPAGCRIREQHVRPGDDTPPYIDLVASCDAAGHRVSLEGQNDRGRLEEAWRYDPQGRMIEHVVRHDGATHLIIRMRYDAAGHRLAEEYRDGMGTLTGQRVFTYGPQGDVLTEQTDDLVAHRWTRETYLYEDAMSACDGGRPAAPSDPAGPSARASGPADRPASTG